MIDERYREVIFQLYPVENLSDSRNKIKALFGENFSTVDELFKGAIQDICEKISRGNMAEIYASEIFYALVGNFLLEHSISKEANAVILEYLYQLMDIAGFFPTFIIEEWKKKSTDELSLEEIEKFAKKNNFFSWVSLTGGEPFLRKDIVEIADAFNQNCRDLYL